jgi:lysophospholipase L1-like esterase
MNINGNLNVVGGRIGSNANPLPPSNHAPTDIALSVTSIAENNAVGDVIGAFSTTDPDTGNTFVYTLVAGVGNVDNASFSILGANLKAGAVFDYETKSNYSIRVRSTDQGGLYFEKVFAITVTNVDESPIITSPVQSDITDVAATVGATLDCKGLSTVWSIEYGATNAYGSTQAGGTTSANGAKTVGLTGLTQNSTIHWRFKAVNSDGTAYSADQTLTTVNTELITYVTGLATPLSSTQKGLLNTFVSQLKSGLNVSALSDVFDFMYVFAGETSESALKNLVKNAHHATAVNSPVFTSGRGFAGNGTSSYLNSNFNPSTQAVNYLLNSAAIGLFSNTNSGGATLDMGARTTSTSNRIVLATRYNDAFIGHLNTHNVATGFANTNSAGHFIVTRTGVNVQVDYLNGVNVKAETDSSSALPNTNMVIGAMNTAGTIGLWSARQYSFAFAGRGLSQAEILVVKNALTNYLDNFYLTANILYSGSSTTAAYAGASAIATLINTLGVETDISSPANTIANQETAYNALSGSVKSNIDKVFLMIGGNDMEPGTTAVSKINELKSYISTIKTGSPRAKIYLATLHPFKQRLIDLYGANDGLISYQKWLDYNEAIRGQGANAITTADFYFDQHTVDLNDGSGNLKAEYDTGDHIHMTDAGKAFIVNAFLGKIVTVG